MAYVTRPWHVFALRAVQGLFAGYGGLTLAMAAESAPRERMATAIGLVQTAQRLGPALGPVIGGVVAELVGMRRAFFVTAGSTARRARRGVPALRGPGPWRSRAPESATPQRGRPVACCGPGVPADDGGDLRADVRRPQLRPDPAALRRARTAAAPSRSRWSRACCSRWRPRARPPATTLCEWLLHRADAARRHRRGLGRGRRRAARVPLRLGRRRDGRRAAGVFGAGARRGDDGGLHRGRPRRAGARRTPRASGS